MGLLPIHLAERIDGYIDGNITESNSDLLVSQPIGTSASNKQERWPLKLLNPISDWTCIYNEKHGRWVL